MSPPAHVAERSVRGERSVLGPAGGGADKDVGPPPKILLRPWRAPPFPLPAIDRDGLRVLPSIHTPLVEEDEELRAIPELVQQELEQLRLVPRNDQ